MMHGIQNRILRAACMALLFALIGCTADATQVIVTIDAEPGVRAAGPRLRVVVLGGAGRETSPTAPRLERVLTPGMSDPAYPFDVALAPLDGDVGRTFSVTATATTGATPDTFVAQARLIGGYVEGQTQRVRLVLEDACRNVMCGDGQTCKAGACIDARILNTVDAGIADMNTSDALLSGDAGHDAGDRVDAGATRITLRGEFVSGVVSGSSGGVGLRGGFFWGAGLRSASASSSLRQGIE